MSREIKFRARTVRTGEWIYFDLRGLEQGTFKDQFIWETVDQSTGLKDKNEKEAYHKDIVKRDELCEKFVGILEWVENADYEYRSPSGWSFDSREIPHITGWMIKIKGHYEPFNSEIDEVIGNTHENLELLSKETR